jgi:ATP-dependent Clp protease protease subunit
MTDRIAQTDGQSVDQNVTDSDRDRWFTAEQAMEYGFVDHVVANAAQARGGGTTD